MASRSDRAEGGGAGGAIRLQVRDLACRRGDRVLFESLGFSVAAGAIVWVRGANGQGKTTLLRTLAGLAAPAAGAIVHAPGQAAAVVYVAHANALKDDLTVAESLAFLLALSGAPPDRARIDTALDRFGLAGRRNAFVRTLSQGQRRRVSLARLAALPEPRLWLLDEPYDALDAGAVAGLDALLVEHARRGGSVVLASHLALSITDPAPTIVELHEPVPA